MHWNRQDFVFTCEAQPRNRLHIVEKAMAPGEYVQPLHVPIIAANAARECRADNQVRNLIKRDGTIENDFRIVCVVVDPTRAHINVPVSLLTAVYQIDQNINVIVSASEVIAASSEREYQFVNQSIIGKASVLYPQRRAPPILLIDKVTSPVTAPSFKVVIDLTRDIRHKSADFSRMVRITDEDLEVFFVWTEVAVVTSHVVPDCNDLVIACTTDAIHAKHARLAVTDERLEFVDALAFLR